MSENLGWPHPPPIHACELTKKCEYCNDDIEVDEPCNEVFLGVLGRSHQSVVDLNKRTWTELYSQWERAKSENTGLAESLAIILNQMKELHENIERVASFLPKAGILMVVSPGSEPEPPVVLHNVCFVSWGLDNVDDAMPDDFREDRCFSCNSKLDAQFCPSCGVKQE